MEYREKDYLDNLKRKVEVPDIVWKKTEEALEQIQKQGKKKRTVFSRCRWTAGRAAAAAVAATLVLGTVTVGAMSLAGWHQNVADELEASEEQQTKLSGEGMVTDGTASAADNGITVESIQTIADSRYIYFWFKVINENPKIELTQNDTFRDFAIQVEGQDAGFGISGGSFEDTGEEGVYLCSYYGSFERGMEPGSIRVKADFNGISAYDNHLQETKTCQGTWNLEWDVQVGAAARNIEVKKEVPGYEPVTLDRLELSPISCTAYFEAWEGDAEEETPVLAGFRMRDGSIVTDFRGGPGMSSEENGIFKSSEGFAKVVDTDDITGIFFIREDYADTGERELTESDMVEIALE